MGAVVTLVAKVLISLRVSSYKVSCYVSLILTQNWKILTNFITFSQCRISRKSVRREASFPYRGENGRTCRHVEADSRSSRPLCDIPNKCDVSKTAFLYAILQIGWLQCLRLSGICVVCFVLHKVWACCSFTREDKEYLNRRRSPQCAVCILIARVWFG
jgi:hypothetical protein